MLNSDGLKSENVTWLCESTTVSEFAGQTLYLHCFKKES